jgi:hypothetical protein
VTFEILNAAGDVVNTYRSTVGPVTAAGQAQAAGEQTPRPAMMAGGRGRGGRGGGARVTLNEGLNRFVWDVRHQVGVTAPSGRYQVRMTVGSTTLTQGLNVLIDPRVAADGVTADDLVEQFEHNMRMREMVNSVNQLVARVQEAQTRLRGETGASAERTLRAVDAIAAVLLTEPVRYGKPGLQAQISYLNGIGSRSDQKIGREVLQRYEMLSEELAAVQAEVARVLGPGS